MKLLKKGLCALVAGAIIMGTLPNNFVRASNYNDTQYYFNYNGDGSDITTETRSKEDASATYVKVDTTSLGITVAAAGTNTYSAYGPGIAMEYVAGYYTVKPGYQKYMPNRIYQNGYTYAYLAMGSSNHRAGVLSGKWSPDNCSGY